MEALMIRKMIDQWKEEFANIREHLIIKGGESHTQEYNLLATEALRLSMCISDATDCLLVIRSKKQD